MKPIWKELNDKVMYYGFDDRRFEKMWEITGVWWELENHGRKVIK